MKNANVSMVKFGIEINWSLNVMLYECHIIPIAIKNIVDKFLQNGQIIRILHEKRNSDRDVMSRFMLLSYHHPVYKKVFL